MTVVVAGFAATHSPLLDIAAHRPWIPSLESPENVLEGIYVVHIHGSLFFGNAGPLQQKLGEIQDAKSLIIDMRDVRYLDQSGVYTLSDLIEDMMRRGVTVYLSEMHEEPSEILAELEVAPGTLPVEQIFATVEGAVEKAARQAAGETSAQEPTKPEEALFSWGSVHPIGANEALERLIVGNQRYVRGQSLHPHTNPATRRVLVEEQRPFAVILGCSDTRSVPELVFDQGIGELFVVRVAGNIMTLENNASIEYAVKFLGVWLVVVPGHQGWSAVDAVIDDNVDHSEVILNALEPAVEQARDMPGDLLTNAIQTNAHLVAAKLKEELAEFTEGDPDRMPRIIPAYYHLDSGKVDLMEK